MRMDMQEAGTWGILGIMSIGFVVVFFLSVRDDSRDRETCLRQGMIAISADNSKYCVKPTALVSIP